MLKKVKKAIVGFFVMTLTVCSAAAFTANAGPRRDHIQPYCSDAYNVYYCNNTYYDLSDPGDLQRVYMGTHTTDDGRTCTITGLFYDRTMNCTACGAAVGTKTYQYATIHSLCGDGEGELQDVRVDLRTLLLSLTEKGRLRAKGVHMLLSARGTASGT